MDENRVEQVWSWRFGVVRPFAKLHLLREFTLIEYLLVGVGVVVILEAFELEHENGREFRYDKSLVVPKLPFLASWRP